MSTNAAAPGLPYARPLPDPLVRGRRRIGPDLIMRVLTGSSAIIVLLMLASLVSVLLYASMPSIRKFGVSFLTTSVWRPEYEYSRPKLDAQGHAIINDDGETESETVTVEGVFGALPVIYGTAMSSLISLVFAVPLSFGAALFLVRIAPRIMAGPVSFLIEFLAAIPSLAYGIWGLFVLGPFLQRHVEPFCRSIYQHAGSPSWLAWMFQEHVNIMGKSVLRQLPLNGSDMLCGSLVLAVMILPIITAISRDVLKSVPRAQIEATVALGATWWQSSWEMLRYCRSGLFGAVMLGLARAAGETMAITMVIGNNNQIRASLFAPAQTMSSLLANEFAEASHGIYTAALTEVALVLLLMSLLFNVVARYLVVGKNGAGSRA